MARYNSVVPVTSFTGASIIATPDAGLLSTFTGTAPYTVTLASPVLYSGIAQSFFNATSGTITIATPAGQIRGPGFTNASTQIIPTQATYTITSDGTNYIITNNEGGPQLGTTGNFSSLLTASSLSVTTNATVTGTLTINGTAVTASSAFTPTNTYDLMTKTYTELKYGKPWTVVSSNVTAAVGDRMFVDTSAGARTIALPAAGLTVGDVIQFVDYSGTFGSNALTVNNNGNPIMRTVDVMTVSTSNAAFRLVWSGAAKGWLIDTGI